MDSEYYCFLPVPTSWCPELVATVPCDLAGLCVVWVLMTQWHGFGKRLRHVDDLSQDALLPHLFRLGDSSAREDADSMCSGSFLEELFPGMMILHRFLAIHFAWRMYSEKKKIIVQTWYHPGMFSNSHGSCRGGGEFLFAMLCEYLTANYLNKAYFGSHKVRTSNSE